MSDGVMRGQVAIAAEVSDSPRLHDLIAVRATRNPDAVAIRTDRRQLSYREVATAAGLLAATLTAAGVRPGDVVAVGVRSGWEQAPAVLGVVQTGAIYVPVDPSAPMNRIDLLLRDCTAPFAVTTLADADRWPVGTTVIILETVWRYGLNDRLLGLTPVTFDLPVHDVGAEGVRDQERRLIAVVRSQPGTTVSPHELRAGSTRTAATGGQPESQPGDRRKSGRS